MLVRAQEQAAVMKLLSTFPVVALIGARQVGKTTLAREVAAQSGGSATFFDLEDPEDLASLAAPKLALAPLEGLVVIDEIQRLPELFPLLRVLVDRRPLPARFLVLGSASPDLLRQSSESLAGRIAYHELGPFGLDETGEPYERLWLRGGFPLSYLARSDADSYLWRGELIRTYLERDLPMLGLRLAPDAIRRFWNMVAHYHGQTWNGAELSRALGVSESTVRSYLGLLEQTFMVRRLQPFHDNLGKRLVKAPKVYISDTGLLHRLLGLQRRDELLGHPKVGASWEGFAIESVVRHLGARREECFFWGLHSGAELDLVVERGRRRLGFEMKLTDHPRFSRSMHSALETLGLERIDVIHPGSKTFPLANQVRAVALPTLEASLVPLDA